MARHLYVDGKQVVFIKVDHRVRTTYAVSFEGKDVGEVYRGTAPSGYWGHWRFGAHGGAATRAEAALRLLREKGLIP